ncbi:MAG: hypothetical protein MZV70_73285 [Desulfobacterales bacterium]|nr:hypothetical protein [Desulfobacterales bacterium]
MSQGIIPRCHFEDVTRADIYGFCIPFARELMKLARRVGIDVKIRLCDTMGYGVSFPGAALPRAVDKLRAGLHRRRRRARAPAGVARPQRLPQGRGQRHHGLALRVQRRSTAPSWASASAPATRPSRPWSSSTFAYGATTTSIDTTAITETGRVRRARRSNYHIPRNYPFVGNELQRDQGGHPCGRPGEERGDLQHLRHGRRFLNRPIEIAITDKSGKAGIAHWVNSHFKLEESNRIDKRHPGITRMYQQIVKEFEDGRNTSMTDEELEKLAMRFIPHLFLSGFDLIKYEAQEYASQLIEKLLENEDMKSMNPKKQEPVITEFIKEYPFIQFAYVTDMLGIKITKNITQPEYRGQFMHKMKENEDCSDREWFIRTSGDGQAPGERGHHVAHHRGAHHHGLSTCPERQGRHGGGPGPGHPVRGRGQGHPEHVRGQGHEHEPQRPPALPAAALGGAAQESGSKRKD